MGSPAISVRNLSKYYKLGEVSTGTLVHDINRWWHRLRGKPDPYSIIGKTAKQTNPASETEMWALDDVSFDVQPGEIVGILGRNGAGKSTLLKVLSRITSPSTGTARVRGRLASLLEVGTGFHPELTGRENIFLNGAILGMSRAEVASKFDEIAAFSGVERFLETPVKRYSSGMYVRLAFSVAAHLNPDVLVIDEVLAVGDADFQKRCIARMDDVAKSGRTVLFVSHNLGAVQALCNTVIRLERGKLVAHSNDVGGEIATYLAADSQACEEELPKVLSEELTIEHVQVSPGQVIEGAPLNVNVTMGTTRTTKITDFALLLYDLRGVRVAVIDGRANGVFPLRQQRGSFKISFEINSLPVVPGTYRLGLYVISDLTNYSSLNLVQLTVLEKSSDNFAPYPVEHRGLIGLDFSVAATPQQS